MLTIRPEQADLLADKARRSAHERLLAFVRDQAPELAAQAGPALDRRVASAAARAEAWGLAGESDRAHFTLLDLALGERFEDRPEHAPARAVLERRGRLTAAQRLAALRDHALRHLERAAVAAPATTSHGGGA
jgi:hypothetical protein